MPSSAPFSVGHFQEWARSLELDDGTAWEVDDYFLAFAKDVFAGFPQCWLLVPEGNAKTTNLAGLALYHCEHRPKAFVPWAASARDQAEIGYTQAKLFTESMVTPPKCFDGYRRIRFGNGSRIQVFAAGSEHADGVIPTLPIIDELHRHSNLSLYRTWAGKLKKRGGQLLTISTAGVPGEEFEETRERIKAEATDVRQEGAFVRAATERVVLHEWAVRDEQVGDMQAVKAANPHVRITVESLAEKRADPTMTDQHWRRFTCNLAAATKADEFISAQEWADLGVGAPVVPGAAVCLGADGSRTWDTTVVAWASVAGDGRVDVDARVFSVRKEVAHHVLHSGGKIDFEDVEEFIIDRFDVYDVREAAYDPRYLERSMEIVEVRLPESCVFAIEPNSKAMRDALQELYRLVAERKLRHRGDPVLAAHLANATVDRGYSSEIRRVRKANQQKPIDAVPAMALAVWRATHAAAESVYESRGLAVA